jgi:hypothetical protein
MTKSGFSLKPLKKCLLVIESTGKKNTERVLTKPEMKTEGDEDKQTHEYTAW